MAERSAPGLIPFRPGPALLSVLALILIRSVANLCLWHSGFVAISDDDFARVAIAQQFAHSPSFDPSGTSWLPLPFWLLGSALALLGSSLQVAQWCSFAFSLLATGLHWVAARWFALSTRLAFCACLVMTLLPHSLWLGLATVPEGYTAALCLVAIASCHGFTLFHRNVGALAMLAATLCRYETWPIAGVFAGLTLCDVLAKKLPRSALLGAALALIGIAGWLLHGALSHGDALFFLTRVTDYRHALGASSAFPGSVLSYPALPLRAEPELALLFLLGLLFVPALNDFSSRYRRMFLFVGVFSLLLIAGDASGGGATHHLERPLLLVWLLMAVMAVDAWQRILYLSVATRRKSALVAIGLAAAGLLAVRERILYREPFVDRSEELAIAQLAKPQLDRDPGVVAIDCPDYGYLAVQAALNMPGRALPVHSHDPRGDVTVTPEALGAKWLITPAVAGQTGRFALQRLRQ